MNYLEKIDKLAKDNMTEIGYKLWIALKGKIPSIWEKPTSSTGKYHKKKNGRVPSVAEHTYEMLYAAVKISAAFKTKPKTNSFDTLVFAIALHDSFKYGLDGKRSYTDNKHDKLAADIVVKNKDYFLKVISEDQFNLLNEAIRFHSGIWSTDLKGKKDTDFFDKSVLTHLVHFLDMLSTKDVLKID